jgi:outer membrane protein
MKQFYKLSLLMVALLAAGRSRAQQEGQASFTLEQCIEYALKNSISAQNAEIDQQIAAAKVKETIGLGLPQIDGTVQLVHNPQLQRFFTQYNPGGGGFFDLSQVPNIKGGDVVAAKNFFQLKNSGSASVTVSQLLFSGNYLVGLQASKAYKELSYKAAIQNKEQIVQQVTKAYYGVLINNERAELFSNSIARVDSLLKNISALSKSGFVENIDVDRVKVTLNNLKAERDKFLNFNHLGLELLKFQMSYPLDQNLSIVGNIQEIVVDATLSSYKEGWDYKLRADYKYLETAKHLQELNIKNQYAGALPTLAAFGTFGYSTQSDSFGGLFTTNSSVKDENGVGPDSWYDYSLVGVTLNVPIFNGFQRKHKITQEKLSLQKIDNGFKSLKQGIDLETKSASIQFENAVTSMTAQKENMDLASNVARITKIKYQQGVGSNLEVVEAENSLRQAQTNYYSALYDAMIAKVDLDKAYGKLIPATTKESK